LVSSFVRQIISAKDSILIFYLKEHLKKIDRSVKNTFADVDLKITVLTAKRLNILNPEIAQSELFASRIILVIKQLDEINYDLYTQVNKIS
jgi:hypothetical protein